MFRFSFTTIVIVLTIFCTKVSAVIPVAEFTATDTFPCLAETVTFTDQSSNVPTSWLWAFTPATITYTGGTSSASQNPKVQFNAYGTYQVSLTATNIDGGNTKTKSAYIVAGGLGGTYTIGPGGDYITFNDAVSDLNAMGICSNVTFNVTSALYTEQISLNEIRGTSAAAKIIFQSATGVNTNVILQFASSSTFSDPNYVVQLDGSDYVTFRNMTIQRTGANLYARVVDFSGNASNNVFEGNRLIGRTGSTSNSGAIIISEDANAGNTANSFINNIIQDGHAGIWWESSSGNSKSSLTVSGNSFSNYRYAVILNYVNDVVITGNTIIHAVLFNSAQTKGIDCFRCEQGLTITKNFITLPDATSNYGIDLQASVGSALKVGNISNNMIIIGGTGTSHGINSGSLTSYKNYFFNSVITNGTNATSSSAYYQNGSTNINLKNNVLVGSMGNAVEILAPTSGLVSSDYNDLFTMGIAVANWGGTNAATLTAWRSASGFDVNSVSADPQFLSAIDLHASAPTLENAADPVIGITDDIDGDVRDATRPDIGADEFSMTVDSCAGFAIDSVAVSDATCFGDDNGSIGIFYSGGTWPIFFSIDSGLVFIGAGLFTALVPGSYEVLLRDSMGCEVAYNKNPVVISEPAPLSLTFSVTDESMNGANDGAIDLTVSGGNGNYQYLWSNVSTTEDLGGLSGGVYCVTVSDLLNCDEAGCDTVETLIPTGFLENGSHDVQLFPNPAEDNFELNILLQQPAKIKLEMMDMSGKKIMEWASEETTVYHRKINVQHLPASLYVIKIQAGQEIFNRRLLKK